MSAHTPGPWRVSRQYGSQNGIEHAQGFVAFVATPREVSQEKAGGESWLSMRERIQPQLDAIAEEKEANARLIAAAPELLGALEVAKKVLEGVELTDYPVSDELELVRAAIARATGGDV